jgi:hypothetical protein
MAKRIRLSRARGFRLPAGAVNVARPGKRGNPWVVGRDGTRLQCAAMFAQLARGFVEMGNPRIGVDEQLAVWKLMQSAEADLAGRDIACWCALDGGACHGDIWLHLANGSPLPEWWRGTIELSGVRIGMAIADLLELQRRSEAKVPAHG